MANNRLSPADLERAIAKGMIPADAVAPKGMSVPAEPGGKRKSKYGNRKVVVGGIEFDSAKEAKHYSELLVLKAAGEVLGFERQVPYDLTVNGVLVCRYVADFRVVRRDGTESVQDVKSPATRKIPAYRIKVKLMLAVWGIEVEEV